MGSCVTKPNSHETKQTSHGTNQAASWSEHDMREFLSKISGLDATRLERATTKCQLLDILNDPLTLCHRVWGVSRLPQPCSARFIAEVRRLRKEDPEEADRMIAQKRCGQLMASRMVEDAKLCLEDLKAEGQIDWLQTLSPDWTDSVALLRSVYAARCNVASMIRISQLTGSSTHSFCILLTIMRAIEFNDWTQACKMWAFENAPDGGHPIVGGTPEMMLECDTAQLDLLLQPDDFTTLDEDACEDCSVCLCAMEKGECTRMLKCGHSFHQACIGNWIDTRWKQAHHLGAITSVSDMANVASYPLCRQSTGLSGGLGSRLLCWQNDQVGAV